MLSVQQIIYRCSIYGADTLNPILKLRISEYFMILKCQGLKTMWAYKEYA